MPIMNPPLLPHESPGTDIKGRHHPPKLGSLTLPDPTPEIPFQPTKVRHPGLIQKDLMNVLTDSNVLISPTLKLCPRLTHPFWIFRRTEWIRSGKTRDLFVLKRVRLTTLSQNSKCSEVSLRPTQQVTGDTYTSQEWPYGVEIVWPKELKTEDH